MTLITYSKEHRDVDENEKDGGAEVEKHVCVKKKCSGRKLRLGRTTVMGC
jgi:hypothetical protein